MLLTTGSGRFSRHVQGTHPRSGLSPLAEQWRSAEHLYQAGRLGEAAAIFQAGRDAARQAGDSRLEMRFLNGLGLCQFASFRYREAAETLLEARRIAERLGDRASAGIIWSNVSSIYAQMGELEGARAAAERALELFEKGSRPNAQLLIRVATLRARQGDWEGAQALFRRSIQVADGLGDQQACALGWNALGYEHLHRGELEAAEVALVEAFRMRRLGKLPGLHLSYRNLALLRMAQGDLGSASRLMDQAVLSGRSGVSLVPLWTLYEQRGRLRVRQKRLEEALEDFRLALDLARRWRLEVLPAEAFRVSLDAGLQQLYGSLLEAAAVLYGQTRRRELAHEAFEAAEENRAASLRALLQEGAQPLAALPAAYGRTLAELHAAEISLLKHDSPQGRARLGQLQQKLIEMELQAGLETASQSSFHWEAAGRLLARTQEALGQGEAFLGFHLGESASYRWALTRGGFRLDRLAPRGQITQRSEAFTTAIRNSAPEAGALGQQLYETLFGGLAAEVRNKSQWLLALDGGLFEAPLAALVVGREQGRPVYLAERHALQLVPSAHLVGSRKGGRWARQFVGVGDAIYNRADTRWSGPRPGERPRGVWGLLPRLTAAPPEQDLELPRLPGSGRELRACAGEWGQESVPLLLEGPNASSEALKEALAHRPAILHVAAHVITARDKPGQALIALSLSQDGRPELVGPAAIRGWGRSAELVVLSGCSSGRGPVLPGAGLLGLSRAWLAAGARSVIASLWPTPDDSGELFLAFYRHLRQSGQGGARAPSAALQRAQREMLASGSWRALPAYWAAYFVVGSE